MRSLILYLFLLGSVYAQSPDSLANYFYAQARSYGSKAQQLESQRKFAEQLVMADSFYHYANLALVEYEPLIKAEQDSLHKMNLLQCYRLIIGYHSLRKEYDQSDAFIQKSFQIVQDTYSEPEKWLFMYHLMKGDEMERRNRPEEAAEHYSSMLEMMETYRLFPAPTLAYYYTITGNLFRKILDLDKAVSFYEQALRLRVAFHGPEHANVALNYLQLGLSYTTARDSAKALENLQKSLDIRIRLFGENHYLVGQVYNDIGIVYLKHSPLEKARYYFAKALGIFRQVLPENHYEIAATLNNMGLAYDVEKNFDLSVEYLEDALKIKENLYAADDRRLVNVHNNLALTNYKRENRQEGLEHVFEAMRIMFPEFHPDSMLSIDFTQLPANHQHFLKWALVYWGLLLTDLGDPGLEDLHKGDQLFQMSMDLVRYQLQEYQFEDAQAINQTSANIIYLSRLNVLHQYYEKTGDESYLAQGYELYEKAKAFLLRKMIREGNILRTGGVPEPLIQKLDSLKKELIFYEQEGELLSSRKVTTEGEVIRVKSISLNFQYDSLLAYIEDHYPVFQQLKQEDPFISLDRIQDKLRENEVILAYWDGHILGFDLNLLMISRNGIRLYNPKTEDNFRQLIVEYKKHLSEADFSLNYFQDFTNVSHRLFEILLSEPFAGPKRGWV